MPDDVDTKKVWSEMNKGKDNCMIPTGFSHILVMRSRSVLLFLRIGFAAICIGERAFFLEYAVIV